MRYAAAEKLEIIRLVEQSSLPVRRTLAQLGISRATFYRWYQRYRARGAVALADGQPAPRRVWNKLPEAVVAAIIELALTRSPNCRRANWPRRSSISSSTLSQKPRSTGY